MKLNTGILVTVGANRIGRDVFDLMKESRVERLRAVQEGTNEIRSEWQAVLDASSEFMATQKPENSWTAPNYETVLKSLRRRET